jgi:hypothetical protein
MINSRPRSASLKRAVLALAAACVLGWGLDARAFDDKGGGQGGKGVPLPGASLGGAVSGPGPSAGHDARGGGGGGGPVSGGFGGGLGPGMGPSLGRGNGGRGGGDGGPLSGVGPSFGHGGQVISVNIPATRGGGDNGDDGRRSASALAPGLSPDKGKSTARGAIAALADEVAQAPPAEQHKLVVQHLIRDHPDLIMADPFGQPAVRGQLLAMPADPEAMGRARRDGFRIVSRQTLRGLDLTTLVLAPPRGMGAAEALRQLRANDPKGQYDFNHLYQESGTVGPRGAGAKAKTQAPLAAGVRVGLIDGAVEARHPALAGVRIVQQPFAPGGAQVTAHATAVASLIAGAHGRFRSAAPGATLYVADVYGPTPAGGSAEAIAQALSWLAEARTPVVNISLVGPPNLVLDAAVRAMIRKGHIVVAAVGNDGPAAPPLYPASYPGVIAVTGVDGRRRLLPEAGRGNHIDFAAPGADMAAAGLDGGFVTVRGTSFAAPIVTGLLARMAPSPDPGAAAQAVARLGREAAPPSVRAEAPLFGRGVVGDEVRTPPASVGARLALRAF